MKYLKYIAIVLFTVFRKVFGLLWFWVVVHFRHIARNVVYNYTLQNKLWLKRLYERSPKLSEDGTGWVLKGGRTQDGWILKQDVSWLKYQFWFWVVWVWVDEDANRDVTDVGFIKTILSGERKPLVKKFAGERLIKEVEYLESCKFGNTFELGDFRDVYRVDVKECWMSVLLWNVRNTGYNAKYKMYETTYTKDIFLITIFGKRFGWIPEGIVDGRQNYTLVFWG